MKKLLLLAFVITIISCKKETPVDYAIVSGTVTNASSDKLTLYNELDFSDKKEIKIAENGSFLDTISLDKSGFYFLAEKRNRKLAASIFYQPPSQFNNVEICL